MVSEFELAKSLLTVNDTEVVWLARTRDLVQETHLIVSIREIIKTRLSIAHLEQIKTNL